MSKKNTIVVVLGPTASGKSRLAVDICLRLGGEVISADSMQIYRGMDIGTAKTLEEERHGVPHHLIDIAEPSEQYSLDDYLKDCAEAVEDILSRGKLPVIAGGTGLYISSFINNVNLSDAKAEPRYREFLAEEAEKYGSYIIRQLLREVDTESYERLSANDLRRLTRALEVYRLTGKTFTENNADSAAERKYDFIIIGLKCGNRDILYERINSRVDKMLSDGLVDEAERLKTQELSATAAQAIGYKELFEYFEGKVSFDQAVEAVKQDSRNYAKRQMTWFKKVPDVRWYDIAETNYEEIMKNAINTIVKSVNICYNKK